RILLTDVTLRRVDAQRNADPLVLGNARVQLDNNGSNRRFALQVAPPAALASKIDLRGEVRSAVEGKIERLDQLSGRLYISAKNWQSQAWRPWLSLPEALSSGVGSAHASLSFAAGKPEHLALDASVQSLHWHLDGQDYVSNDAGRLYMEGQWAQQSAAPQTFRFQWQGRD